MMKRLIYILVLVGGIVLLRGCNEKGADLLQSKEAVMQDGVYEGLGEGRSGMIKVAIDVKEQS